MTDHIDTDDRDHENTQRFVCEHCGSTDLKVVREYKRSRIKSYVLRCGCPSNGHQHGAIRTVWVTNDHHDEGRPSVGLGTEWEDLDDSGIADAGESTSVFCKDCFATASADDWIELDVPESEQFEDHDEDRYLICAGCRRKVGFI
jgi:hypothetical protein